jgi:spore germination protein YaaH
MKKIIIVFFVFLLFSAGGFFFYNFYNRIFLENSSQPNFLSPVATPTPFPTLQFSAWIPWWDEKKSLESLKIASSKLKYISPVWYKIDNSGELREMKVTKKNEVTKIASESGILLIPTIGNDFDGNRISKLLSSAELNQLLIKNMILIAKENKFWGWDLDWEEIKESDRNSFSEFVRILSTALHQENLKLIVTVHAQTGKIDDWIGSKGQDWNSLSKNADALRIMAYDFHHSVSSPGPVTPINKLKEVLDYAISVIPLEKLVVGLPNYGYDWKGNRGEPIQYEKAIALLLNNNGSWLRDKDSFALRGVYTDSFGSKHELWFEDKESIIKKILIAKEYGIYQYCFWSLGGEDKTFWESLSL